MVLTSTSTSGESSYRESLTPLALVPNVVSTSPSHITQALFKLLLLYWVGLRLTDTAS